MMRAPVRTSESVETPVPSQSLGRSRVLSAARPCSQRCRFMQAHGDEPPARCLDCQEDLRGLSARDALLTEFFWQKLSCRRIGWRRPSRQRSIEQRR